MKALYEKLLKVQEEIGSIKKSETNPFFKSKYFDINGLLDAVKPVLTKHGLILLQPLNHEGTVTTLDTFIIDAETEAVFSSSTVLPDGIDPQKQGSTITYFRRYALQSLLGLQAEDDDGNIASSNASKKPSSVKPVQDNNPDDINVTISVLDVFKGETRTGEEYEALKTENGKVMVWKNSNLIGSFTKGSTYDVDIEKGAVVFIYD